jgi:hypothetical protein
MAKGGVGCFVGAVLVLVTIMRVWHAFTRVYDVHVSLRTPIQTIDLPSEGLSSRIVVHDHAGPPQISIVADCHYVVQFADGTMCLSRDGVDKYPVNGPVTEGSSLWYWDHLRFGEDADPGQTFSNGGPEVTVILDLMAEK